MAQLNHYNTQFSKKTFPITLVCDNVTNAPNIGSLFRTADAFGVEKLILCGPYIPLGRKMTKTSRATEKVVPFEMKENVSEVITKLKADGYLIIALEITDSSVSIRESNFSTSQPIALLIGDENFGVSNALLEQSDLVVHIDMFGLNSSMNVVQATNIILYEITKQSI
ncbi:TrmH family RNA methyltransferase [Formosa sp. PL04]|uniref:TrmH family RNA methyltransferase n=1 Tax=Formosa sp. PL04 TaxID=3081755 RepID=UPI0029827B00|nr:TrmH family RNA methyltransferase [Formosa sp. PL04]MDW5288322.1 TrmH family RNA methyltransferase [Formosa sp. PL04]